MKKHVPIILLIVISLVLIIGSFFLALKVINFKREEIGKEKVTFMEFFNNKTQPTLKTVLIGMSFGLLIMLDCG